MENFQTRFAHLLQPIKDLTKNWDVDVAAELEDYLTLLDTITISFDQGQSSMNFAEAAMLIQSSTCVYSKKVEYLYALVYQTLDLIASRKKVQQPSSVDEQGRDADASFANRRDPNEEFILLDDIQKAKNSDMVENVLDSSTRSVSIVPRTPMSLVPLKDCDKATSTPLLSHTNEFLGNRTDYKMNISSVDKSGAFLLEPTSNLLVNMMQKLGESGCGPPTREPLETSLHDKQPLQEGMEMGIFEDNPVMDMDMGCGFNDEDGSQAGMAASPPAPLTPVVSSKRNLRSRLRLREEKVPADPWKLLDPHEPVLKDHQPFKKGSTSRLPPCLQKEQAKSRKRKRKKAECDDGPKQSLAEFLFHAFHSYSSMFPKNPLKAPSSVEFESQFWAEHRRRKQQEAREKVALARLRQESGVDEVAEEAESDEDSYQPLGTEGNDDVFEEQHQVAVEAGQAIGDLILHGAEPPGFDDLEGNMADDLRPTDIGADVQVVQSYEVLVRNYVESTVQAALCYARETELTKRVREWEDRIIPVLSLQDDHQPFDIREYGSRIVSQLHSRQTESDGQRTRMCFREIVQGQEPFEICRMFTATLQLANDYNVEICEGGEGKGAVNTLTLRLLSADLPQGVVPENLRRLLSLSSTQDHSPSSEPISQVTVPDQQTVSKLPQKRLSKEKSSRRMKRTRNS